tara:strand:- start:525 stop:716 length:192 start_codon:yes stop_codon:yes gene_type:complete
VFKINEKEYDETKLEGKAKVAFENLKLLQRERDDFLLKIERNRILVSHYSKIIEDNLPKEDKK